MSINTPNNYRGPFRLRWAKRECRTSINRESMGNTNVTENYDITSREQKHSVLGGKVFKLESQKNEAQSLTSSSFSFDKGEPTPPKIVKDLIKPKRVSRLQVNPILSFRERHSGGK